MKPHVSHQGIAVTPSYIRSPPAAHVGPVVTDVGVFLNDEGWDAQSTKTGGNHETILTTSDDEDGGIRLFELDLLLALLRETEMQRGRRRCREMNGMLVAA